MLHQLKVSTFDGLEVSFYSHGEHFVLKNSQNMGNKLSSHAGNFALSENKIKVWDLIGTKVESEDETEIGGRKVNLSRYSAFVDLENRILACRAMRNSSSNDASCEEEEDSPTSFSSHKGVNGDCHYSRTSFQLNNFIKWQESPFTSCALPVKDLIAEPNTCIRCYLPRIDCMCTPHSTECSKFALRMKIGESERCKSCLYNPRCSGCSYCGNCFGYDGCLWCSGCDWCRHCSNYMGCKYYKRCSWCTYCVGCSWCRYCVGRVAYGHDNAQYWERGMGWTRYVDF